VLNIPVAHDGGTTRRTRPPGCSSPRWRCRASSLRRAARSRTRRCPGARERSPSSRRHW
jgi:hypothetical protein